MFHALFAAFDPSGLLIAVLIGVVITITVATGRWIMSGSPNTPASDGTVRVSGAQYIGLALALAVGIGGVIAIVAMHNR
jgi:hypothetical protein